MAHDGKDSTRRVVVLLGFLLAVYLIALLLGWPQRTAALIAAHGPLELPAHEAPASAPSPVTVLPFALLLCTIALAPLLPRVHAWWENHWHQFWVAGGLGLAMVLYYLCFHGHGILGHWPVEHHVSPSPGALDWNIAWAVVSTAILREYLPFIILLGSLYTISGGIRITGDLPAHPLTNTIILAIGAVLANVIGTTGAAMLLIRPLLETNQERRHVRHTVVMFLFVVCNCGGCLLPLGDPPLFLGYLRGVPFFWTLKLWPAWLAINGMLLVVYYLADHFWFYPREKLQDVRRDETQTATIRVRGLWPNGLLLLGVVLSVALLEPSKVVPGTIWHPWAYLREAIEVALTLASLALGSAAVRRDNAFNYGPILEVAVLFLGIFLTMQAPLEILNLRGPTLGLTAPHQFFWATGSLSAVLDNAPTYAVFFETARSLGGQHTVAGVEETLLEGISLGAVLMGAMTYIGNGPNFMVKAIAEKSGVAMPGFFGYLLWSSVVLLPLYWIVTRLFL
jgi:Na+/H+ antiporter NhaD/arsenite permease-like protein